jgi:hypothetical protein
MHITSTLVRITNNGIAGSNTNDTNNDNDCGDNGGVGLRDGWPRFPVHRQHIGPA